MKLARLFLVGSALALVSVSLNYGVDPVRTLDALLGIKITSPAEVHMFRAIMGLYLAFAGYWLVSAARLVWVRPALVSEMLLMGGLAAGRVLSLVLDGRADPVLERYLLIEVVLAALAGVLLARLAVERRRGEGRRASTG